MSEMGKSSEIMKKLATDQLTDSLLCNVFIVDDLVEYVTLVVIVCVLCFFLQPFSSDEQQKSQILVRAHVLYQTSAHCSQSCCLDYFTCSSINKDINNQYLNKSVQKLIP